ncbi:hypothetical protein ABTD83_19900, partial [Acinetobacter baumannii]
SAQQPADDAAVQNRSFTIPVDGPLSVTLKGNRVEINVVMGISGQVEGMRTVLSLTPEASGQLIGCIKKALDEGLMTFTLGRATPLQ